MRTLALIVCALVVGTAAPARADDSIRCGQWLVRIGATEGEVEHKCGAPTEAYTDTEYDVNGFAYYVDRWVYNRGPYELVRTVIFRGGALVRVVVGRHGY